MTDNELSEEKQDEYKESTGPEEGFRQRLEGWVPDLIRRTVAAGIGAVFSSEEGIRKLANDFSLPKDLASYLISQAHVTKDELFRVVAREVQKFLEGLNLNEELERLLTSISFEIKTEIRFIPNDATKKLGRPKIKHKVAIKRRAKEEEEILLQQTTDEDLKKDFVE